MAFLVCETFFTILNAFDIDEADYILLLSINHVVDMLSYLIFDTKYYVIAFFTPWEVDIGSVELIAVFTVIFAGCWFHFTGLSIKWRLINEYKT